MDKINFRKERNLGETLQDASTFIRQHFMKMIKPTLIVVAVPLLLGAVFMIMALQNMYSSIGTMTNPLEVYSSMAGMLPAYLLIIVAYVIAYVMFVGYIKLYVNGQEDIQMSDLMTIVKSKALPLAFSSILLIVITYIGMILCVFPGVYISVALAHFFAVSIVEEVGFGTSWKRCIYLIKDRWWNCFGLYFVTYLIALGLIIVAYIPTYMVMFAGIFDAAESNDPAAMTNAMSQSAYITPIYYLLGIVTSMLFAVVTTMRYYSLVEQKDGTGEQELINTI